MRYREMIRIAKRLGACENSISELKKYSTLQEAIRSKYFFSWILWLMNRSSNIVCGCNNCLSDRIKLWGIITSVLSNQDAVNRIKKTRRADGEYVRSKISCLKYDSHLPESIKLAIENM